MYKSVILVFFVFASLVGACVNDINVNVCGGDSCCPTNSSLKCCCETDNINYLAVTKKVSYWEAFIRCREVGMDLATITSQEQQNALTTYLKTVTKTVGNAGGVWIGGLKWIGTTDFYWAKTGEPVLYTAFLPGQPNFFDTQLCLMWLISDAGNLYGWNNWNCNDNLAYVCQTRRHCI